MAGTANTNTYDNRAIREDLLGIITNLTPQETQLVAGLGVNSAEQPIHQWLKDTLKSVATNAYVEGVDASYPVRTDPSRLLNYTQIVRVGYKVSDTDQVSNAAGFDNRKSYEATKAMKEWKNDMELALMRGSLVCGSATGARQLKGVKNWLNNVTAQSGVSLTETMLNDYLQNVWSDGTTVNAIYCPMYIKRKISGFNAGNKLTVNTQDIDRRIVNAVDVYQADAAPMVKLFSHRYVTIAGDTNYDIVGVNEDFFKIAYLRRPFTRDLAKTGDSENSEVIGEGTLECLHEDAGFWSQHLL